MIYNVKLHTIVPKIIVIFLISFVFLPGCRHPCLRNHINPALIGFSPADIDTLVLRAYKPNDSYLHLIDTVLIVNGYSAIYTTTNDTTVVFVNDSNPGNWISPGFDWQIYIPAKNRIVSVSNIVSGETSGPGRACLNPINSFIQDGQHIVPGRINTGQDYTSGYMAYIHN
jgi:hypothetical protein